MKKIIFISLIFINLNLIAQNFRLSGYVKDIENNEAIVHASLFIECTNQYIRTNEYGFYSVLIPQQLNCFVSITSTNHVTLKTNFELKKDSTHNFMLYEKDGMLKTIDITVNSKLKEVKSTRMSVMELKTSEIKNVPTIGGELDILKVIQLLPGVQKGVEGQSGFQVRGGDADQNLILLDEATVYNVSHLFGFFGVFIPEAIENMEIYKGGFPAEYGGRLSSILDIRMKEGSSKKFKANGGIGILSSRLTLEGPLIKDKSSIIVSARRTYVDQIFKLFKIPLPYYFYDFNVKANYILGKKDKLFYSMYYGNDVLKIGQTVSDSSQSTRLNFGFQLGNFTNTLRWNHVFDKKLFSNTSIIYTRFKYNVTGDFLGNSIYIGSRINDIGVKLDFTYFKNKNNLVRFGGQIIRHEFKPNIISSVGDITALIKNQVVPSIINNEISLYGRNEQEIGKFKINYGMRLSSTTTFDTFFAGAEPRLAIAYDITKYGALKIGFSRMMQYLHLVSSGSVALPTDLWYPVSKNVKPQNSNQLAMSYQHLLPKKGITLTAEAYYKTMENLTEYKEGAVLILNNNYEKELLQGKGRAYGLEFLIRKDKGQFNGWISYTLGFSDRIFAGLNQGERFPSKFDRRHNFAIVSNYILSKRWDVSAVWTFASGSRFTAQIGQYLQPKPGLNGVDLVPIYTKRNQVRMSPSHRLDINFVLKQKKVKEWNGEWHFSAYNFYNRAEPYTVRIKTTEKGEIKYEQPGLFGVLLSVAYNFKF